MKFHVQELNVDLKNLGTLKRVGIKLYMILFNIVEKASARYQRAANNDYPEKSRDFSFHDTKENPMFQEFTYLEKYSVLKRLIFKNQLILKIIYLRKMTILLQAIPNLSEKALKKATNTLCEQERIICSKRSSTYVNQHDSSILLQPNYNKFTIHKIILCAQNRNHPTHFNAPSLIYSEKIITHIFKAKEYYFILNHLLTISEVNNYLSFREAFIKKEKNASISEYKLLEQYTRQEESKKNFLTATSQLDLIKLKTDDWTVILKSLFDSTIGESSLSKQAYYFCLVHLANLRLHQAIQFQEKFNRVYEKIIHGKSINHNDIDHVEFGFVFIPENNPNNDPDTLIKKYNILLNSYRYQNQLTGCIGILFVSCKTSNSNPACNVFWWVHHYDYAQPVDD